MTVTPFSWAKVNLIPVRAVISRATGWMSYMVSPSTPAEASPGRTFPRMPPWSQFTRGSSDWAGQLLVKMGRGFPFSEPAGRMFPFSVLMTGKPESGEKVAGA